MSDNFPFCLIATPTSWIPLSQLFIDAAKNLSKDLWIIMVTKAWTLLLLNSLHKILNFCFQRTICVMVLKEILWYNLFFNDILMILLRIIIGRDVSRAEN